VEVVGELVAEFQRPEELRSRLERPDARIRGLLLGPPLGQAQWGDCLDEATRQLGAKLVALLEVEVKLEILRASAAQVRDLVLDNINMSSSLAASLSTVVELLEGQINTMAANGVHWQTQSALVATLSHFSELETELELLGSGCNADLTDDHTDALMIWVRAASNLLATHVPPSVVRHPFDNVGE
jgi:hypothetical protein